MSVERLPKDVRELLSQRIMTFEELEALLFLRRHRSESWNAEAVATKLGLTVVSAHEALAQLCKQDLLVSRVDGPDFLFRYGPSNSALEASVEQLVQANEEHRVAVLKHLSRSAIQRVRNALLVVPKKDS